MLEDGFDTGSLGDQWAWIDPNRNDSWSLTANRGFLRIVAAYLSGNPVADAGRMTLSISGDFVAETSVTMVDPRNSFQQSGILLWHDEDNHLRFHLTYSYQRYLHLLWVENGVPGQKELVDYRDAPNHLRVVRDGSNFAVYHSADGADWASFTTVALDLPTDLEIGLFARYGNNRFGDTFSADFDYFSLVQR